MKSCSLSGDVGAAWSTVSCLQGAELGSSLIITLVSTSSTVGSSLDQSIDACTGPVNCNRSLMTSAGDRN